MADGPSEPKVALVAEHELDNVFGVPRPHRHLDPRVGGDELLQELRQDICAGSRGRGDDQVAGGGRFDLLERVAALGEGPPRPLSVGHPCLAGFGQRPPMGSAQKEGRAQLLFESMEAGGEGRLGDEESLRRPAHAAPARDFKEAFHLDQLKRVDLAVTRLVYGHGRGHKFYLWRSRMSVTADQTASTQTGPIVMTNGRIVSLAEWEARSKAEKTGRLP